ncbi:MAG: hypothetical protein QOH87_5287 [Trebonia sp.]|nr:hypothetical protein [Trebonia sp.]
MSHWDFGRQADGEHDAPRPSGAAGAAYPPDLPGRAGDGAWPAQDAWPADGGWPAPDGGWPAPDGWHEGRSPDEGRSPAEGWPPGAGRYPDEALPAEDGWDDDEVMATYPLTYERDDFAADPQPADPRARAPWEPWPPAPYPAGLRDADTRVLTGDDAGEQAPGAPPRGTAGRGNAGTGAATRWTGRDLGLPGDDPADWAAGGARRGGRRWLIPAGVVVAGAAVGAAAVLLTGGHPSANGNQGGGSFVAPSATPSTPPSTAPSPPAAGPLTMTQAKGVLAGYTTVNNGANAQRSVTMLASVESGSSYAIDAGLYQEQQAAGTVPYPAFGPAQATYYLPRDEPASGPRWFVVQVANAFTSNPTKVTSGEYLLFTQSAPGGAWQDTIEPYLLSGASAPRIEVGTDGLATAVSPDAASVAVAPSQLPAATAASVDGTGAGGAGTGTAAVADPGNLADRADQKFWLGKIPGGTVTDTHTAAAGADGQEFALLTAGGGALVFYTDAAQLTITPPASATLHLTIPGFYSPGQALSRAGVSYLEQFAAYDPPAGGGAPRVVADYSGITGKN